MSDTPENDAIARAEKLEAALRTLMPFVLDEYYPDCATQEYKAAVELAKEAIQ